MDEDIHDDKVKVDVANNDSQEISGDDNDPDAKGDDAREGEGASIVFDPSETDDSVSLHPVETTGVELDARNTGVEQETPTKVDPPPAPPEELTESKLFEQAAALGQEQATNNARSHPQHTNKTRHLDPAFKYVNTLFGEMDPEAVLTFMMGTNASDMLVFITIR